MAGHSSYFGEIIIFAGNYAPRNYAQCNGQILSIQQYSPLFSLLGTTYGGNGTSTFALPNLQGNVLIGAGQSIGGEYYELGATGGQREVTLTTNEIPAHQHTIVEFKTSSATGATSSNPIDKVYAETSQNLYATTTDSSKTTTQSIQVDPLGTAGGSGAHNNMQPYLVLNFCIALQGIFPARN